jgi:hypothetical protein
MMPLSILTFSSEVTYLNLDPKGLFDHRTNRRAHGTIGSNPRR